MKRPDAFTDRLLAAETTTPLLRERYEREVKAMLVKTLTPAQRFGFGFATVMSLGLGAVFGYVAATQSSLPAIIRASFGFGSLCSLIAALMVGKVFVQGKMNRRTQPTAMTGLMWGLVVVLVTLFMVFTSQRPNAVWSVYMVVSGLVYLVFAAVFMITNRIDQAQIKTEEQFLEIKFRLAELAEKVEPSAQ